MKLQNHTQVKDPTTVHKGPMDYNLAEYEKFIDKVSNSTTATNF